MSDLPKDIRHKQKILRGLEQRRNSLRSMIVENSSVIQTLESDIVTMFDKLLSTHDEKPTCRQIGVHDDPYESLARELTNTQIVKCSCSEHSPNENPIKELSMYGPKKSGDLKPEDFIVTAPKSDYDLPFTIETLLKIGRELGHFTLPKGENVISQVLKDRINLAFPNNKSDIQWGNSETLRVETVYNKIILVYSNTVMAENDLTCEQGKMFKIKSHQVGVMLGSLKE